MGNVRMRAEQINYGASNVKVALDDLDPKDLIALSERMDTIEAWKATVKTEEKTGAEVTFTNALALDAVSLSAEIEASQDLHGLPFPYVGGAYKNKCNVDNINVGKNYNGDDNPKRACMIFSVPAGTYTISIQAMGNLDEVTVGRSKDAYPIANLENVDKKQLSANDKSYTVTIDNEYGYIYIFMLNTDTNITLDACKSCNIQVESGETATSYAPYSNICPISGRDSVVVDVTGRNLFDGTFQPYFISGGTYIYSYDVNCMTAVIPIIGGRKYTVSKTGGNRNIIGELNKTPERGDAVTVLSTSSLPQTVQTSATAKYLLVYVSATQDTVKLMVEDGETAHTYEQYINNNATISFGQTVYGGTLNVTTGVLTVTHANIASYNGETIGEPWISSMDEYTQGGTPTTGAQVVYPLAAPTTIQLTATQLQMLKGYNRLCSDGGDITVKAYTGAAWGGDEA